MALMTSRSTETVPSASVSLWNVTLRMMRLTLCVGIRTESAMKPMRPISGMTSSRAAAALVEHHVAQGAAGLAQVGGAGLRDGVEHRLRAGDRVHRAHAGGDHVAREVALE